MDLLRMARHKLLATLRSKLSERYAGRFDEAQSVDVVGVFWRSRADWHLGVRVRNRRRHTLYLRARVEIRGIAYCLIVVPSFEPFNWRHHRSEMYQGDNPPAYVRLKGKHERKHLRQEAAAKANGVTGAAGGAQAVECP